MQLNLGEYRKAIHINIFPCLTRYIAVMTADTSCHDSAPSPTSPNPVSPTSTAVSNGDFVIKIQPDPEKGDAIEQDSDANGNNILRQAGESDMEPLHLAPKNIDGI